MTTSLTDAIDGTPFIGLAVDFVQTGYNTSIMVEGGQWSPLEFGVTASEAILKCIQKRAPAIVPPPPY